MLELPDAEDSVQEAEVSLYIFFFKNEIDNLCLSAGVSCTWCSKQKRRCALTEEASEKAVGIRTKKTERTERTDSGNGKGEGSSKRKRVDDAGDEYAESPAEAERRRNKEFRKYVGDRWSELAGWTEDQDKRNAENVAWFEKVTMKLVMLEEKVDRVIGMLSEMKKNDGGAENTEDAEDAEGDDDETMKE